MLAHWGKVGFPEAVTPPMKQIFALLCAFVLLPSYTSHAWIGGPFSNNSYFQQAEDGVYEAIATGQAGVAAVGIFRFAVANRAAGLPSTLPAASVASGNVFIGFLGVTPVSNIWFINGLRYTGTTLGTVNEAASQVFAAAVATRGGSTVDSGFTANISRTGRFVPVVGFRGVGNAILDVPLTPFAFDVFGTKVAHTINLGF
jgi:hypothetical protein